MASRLLRLLLLSGVLFSSSSQSPEAAPRRIIGLKYPRLALFAGVHGRVVVDVVVSPDGSTKTVKAASGHQLLTQAPIESVRQWRFVPTTSGSEWHTEVEFVFRLRPGSCQIDQCPHDLEIDLPNRVTITSQVARAIVD